MIALILIGVLAFVFLMLHISCVWYEEQWSGWDD